MLKSLPVAGRLLAPSDDVRGAAPVAVMSYRAWEREYVPPSLDQLRDRWRFLHGSRNRTAWLFGAMMRSDPPDLWRK
jgi:hypothetical protein